MVDRHQHALHVFLRGMTRHEEQARDLLQDTFHDAWRAARGGIPPFVMCAPDDEMRRWLFAVAYRKVISVRRRQRLLRWDSLDIASGARFTIQTLTLARRFEVNITGISTLSPPEGWAVGDAFWPRDDGAPSDTGHGFTPTITSLFLVCHGGAWSVVQD